MTNTPNYAEMDFSYLLDDSGPAPPDAVIGRGRVTVLRALRGWATKRFMAAKTQEYSIGKYFSVDERPINTVYDLADVLLDIEPDPRAFVIRGTPTTTQRDRVLRRSVGEDATFTDGPCHWVCLDLDSVDSPGPLGAPAAELRNLIEMTPQLRGTTCVAQVSASWGLKAGLRAHLWFWIEEPRTSQQVSEWASGLPFKVDHSLFGPVQPHYTADPVFDGVRDPLVGVPRVFVLRGRVTDALYVPAGTAQAELDHWVQAIQQLDDDDPRHPVVNRAAYSLGGWVGAGVLALDETRDTLYTACLESGVFDDGRLQTIGGEIDRGLRDGSLRPRQCEDWKAGMLRNKDGAIKALPDNFLRLFRSHPSMVDVLGHDVRTDRSLLLKAPPWRTNSNHYPRGIRDSDDVEAAAWVNRLGIHTSAVSQISAAMSAAAESNAIDHVVEWLDALPPWDRKPRLFHWLPQVTGCDDTVFARAAGGRFLISLVARALRPGCKVDDMIVLVGPQGSLKSTLLRTIVSGPGEWAFTDCLGDIRKPQDYMPTLMGPWLVEVAELSQFSRKEVEAVKKFLSTQVDRYRLSYGRRAVDIPRRGVIAGTSNTTDFLSDMTGNRRFWPVDVRALDLATFLAQRDQLFAEALYEYRQETPWYMVGEEIDAAIDEQSAHTVADVWEDRIRQYLDEPPTLGSVTTDPSVNQINEVSIEDILSQCIQIPVSQATPQQSRRAGAILRKLGWRHVRARVGRRRRVWVYRRPERGYWDAD